MPSAIMFCDFWKKITDCWVCGPKIPSGRMLRRSWSCFTDSPVELSFSVFIFISFNRKGHQEGAKFAELFCLGTNAIRPYSFWAFCKTPLLLAFVFCFGWK